MEKEGRNFKKAYYALPLKERKEIRDLLTNEVFRVNNSMTFYYKMNGKQNIPDTEWVKIKKIFDDFGVDAETGEVCQIQMS
jgi:uncharacterized protein with HEPN domain